MAAKAAKYRAGYTGTGTIDGTSYPVRGFKVKDSVDAYDASDSEGAGWSSKERGLRTCQITFSMGLKTTGPPAISVGSIYDCVFTLDGTHGYTGEFLITSMDPSVDLRGGVSYDVTADNHGEITFA